MAAITCTEDRNAISAPITALHFIYNEFLLIGEGSFLKIYLIDENCYKLKIKLFQTCRIHKFRVISREPSTNNFLILCLGGKSVRFFSVAASGKDIRFDFKSEEKCFDTWIWDATEFTPGSSVVALITSQNKVIVWNYESDKVLEVHSCLEHCILYSACFWNSSLGNLEVAVGTVFNEVLIWNIPDLQSSSNEHAVAKRFKGHEGVIFSIRFSSSGEHLLSVSDDRTIRKWDVKTEQCLQVIYGHTARVWDAAYLNEFVVSIGEDATCFVWNDQSQVVRKFKGHKGKNIWSLAVNQESNLIATGGGDASIRLWSLAPVASEPLGCINLPSIDDTGDFPRDLCVISNHELLTLTNDGYLLKYTFKSGEKVNSSWETVFHDKEFSRHASMAVEKEKRIAVFGSLNGRVKVVFIDDKREIDQQVFEGKVFSVSILTKKADNHSSETYVTASGPNGIILLWHLIDVAQDGCPRLLHRGLFELPYCRQRWLAAATLISHHHGEAHAQMSFVVGDRRGSIHVFDVQSAPAEPVTQPAQPKQTLLSMHGKNGVTGVCASQEWVFSTGRDGYFRKYIVNGNGSLAILERKKVCKGMDWIEGMLISDADTLVYGFYMQSHFAIWSANLNEIILRINCGGGYRAWDLLLHHHGKTFFTYLKGPKILLYEKCFTNSQTILKEALHGREITCLCLIDIIERPDNSTILFATGSEDTLVNLIKYDVKKNEFELVHSLDGHIGSVKSAAAVKEAIHDDCIEGTAFREQRADSKGGQFRMMDRSYLLFTCGSRSSLKCNRVFCHVDGHVSTSLLAEIGTPMNSLKTKSRDLYDDLRFMSVEAIAVEHSSSSHCIAVACSDGYVRLYDFETRNRTFTLLMASDFHGRCVQTIRSFACAVDSKRRHFLVSGATDGRIALWDIHPCIDSLSTLEMGNSSNDQALDTQGEKTEGPDTSEDAIGPKTTKRTVERSGNFFHVEKLNSSIPHCGRLLEPLHVFQAHQSGVHCMDIKINQSGSEIALASGGDDNSIFTSSFMLTNHAERAGSVHCTVVWQDRNIFAHHSTITGVQLIRFDTLMSCSIDQRLKVWQTERYESQDGKEKCRWKNTFTDFLDIPDASDMICLQRQNEFSALVSGVGVQIKTMRLNAAPSLQSRVSDKRLRPGKESI